MADNPPKISIPSPVFHGVVVRSTVDTGSILGITLPKLDSRFFTIGPHDVPGTNNVEVLNDSMPLFASEDVSYRGQPLLALFGPDAESVQLHAHEVEFDFQLPGSQAAKQPKREHSPIIYQWGDVEKIFSEAASFVERTYIDRRQQIAHHEVTFIHAYLDNEMLYVETPSQWPFHVRDTVAAVCGRPRKSVTVYPVFHYSPHDETVLDPSVLAAIAALGALKSNASVRIGSRFPTFRSSFTITRKTALDANGKPLAERVEVVIDQGAFPFFTAELFKQVVTGLLPLYPLEAFFTIVRIIESHAPPSHFAGDLGYSAALFSTEAHASAIARSIKTNPANWRINTYADIDQRKQEIETLPAAKLRDLINQTSQAADFARHSAAYELQRRVKHPLSPILTYTKGIGIACGAGISGFSASCALNALMKISLTLKDHNQVLVNTSFYPTKKLVTLWCDTISRELSVGKDTISFIENDTSYMIDSGPQVLALEEERSITIIEHLCRSIQAKRFQQPLPISESLSAKTVLATSTSQFNSTNWGCIVVELAVNTVTLIAEATHVWARFFIGQDSDTDYLKAEFSHAILENLSECKVLSRYRKSNEQLINIAIECAGDKKIPVAATSAIRGMVYAACSSALSQALHCEMVTTPLSSEEMIACIRSDHEH